MGAYKQYCFDQEEKFFDSVSDLMKESESIYEFYGKLEARQKKGELLRPDTMTAAEFEEIAEEVYKAVWSDYN